MRMGGSPYWPATAPPVTPLTLSSQTNATLFRIILWRCWATFERGIAQPNPRTADYLHHHGTRKMVLSSRTYRRQLAPRPPNDAGANCDAALSTSRSHDQKGCRRHRIVGPNGNSGRS